MTLIAVTRRADTLETSILPRRNVPVEVAPYASVPSGYCKISAGGKGLKIL